MLRVSKRFVISSLALLACGISAASAQGNATPSYSIETYCEGVSQASGGSYQIKVYCLKEERATQDSAKALPPIEPRIIKYCAEVGKAAGGSYQIYLYCLKEELKAKKETTRGESR